MIFLHVFTVASTLGIVSVLGMFFGVLTKLKPLGYCFLVTSRFDTVPITYTKGASES